MKLDNTEGMTFGPRLPNGNRTLVFVSDDNFRKSQITQFLAFEVIEPGSRLRPYIVEPPPFGGRTRITATGRGLAARSSFRVPRAETGLVRLTGPASDHLGPPRVDRAWRAAFLLQRDGLVSHRHAVTPFTLCPIERAVGLRHAAPSPRSGAADHATPTLTVCCRVPQRHAFAMRPFPQRLRLGSWR